MKIKEVIIEMYRWKVILLEVESKEDYNHKIIKKTYKKLRKKNIKLVKNRIKSGACDGGMATQDVNYRISVILLYQMTSRSTYLECLAHEKRHVEDYILDCLHIKDEESAAFLAGYLLEKLIDIKQLEKYKF